MKNNVFLYILIICLLECMYSCKNKTIEYDSKYVYTFNKYKEIVIPLNENSFGFIDKQNFNYIYIDSVETIISYYMPNKLIFFDINKKEKYHEIKTVFCNGETINAFKYINKDSIILICEPTFWTERDTIPINRLSKIYLINYYGEKIKEYSFNMDKIKNYDYDSICISKIFPLNTSWLNVNMIGNKIFLLTSSSNQHILGGKKFNLPIMICYDLKTEEIIVSKSLSFPYLKENVFYPGSFNTIQNCISANNFPLLRFFYSSDVFEWDYKNDKIIKHNVKTILLDTITPFSDKYCKPNDLDGFFSSIHYNPYQKLYYFGFNLLNNKYGKDFDYTCIITDERFNFITEILKPCISERSIFYKDYLVSFSSSTDSIYIIYSKLEKTKILFNKYIDSVREVAKFNKERYKTILNDYINGTNKNSLINYLLLNRNVTEKDYCILTVFAQSGCPSCSEFILSVINDNLEVFNTSPLYLIITGDNRQMTQKELNGKRLYELNNLVIDSIGIVNNLPYSRISIQNPRLTIVRNDVVVLDTIYDSFHIESDLIPTMLESLGLKQ